jgi:hypothetical protein
VSKGAAVPEGAAALSFVSSAERTKPNNVRLLDCKNAASKARQSREGKEIAEISPNYKSCTLTRDESSSFQLQRSERR